MYAQGPSPRWVADANTGANRITSANDNQNSGITIDNTQSNPVSHPQPAPRPSVLAEGSGSHLPQPQFNSNHQSTVQEVQRQLQNWQILRRDAQFDPNATPHLSKLYQQLTAAQNGGAMASRVPANAHKRVPSSQPLETSFWSTVSKLPSAAQEAIFKELREGSGLAYSNARLQGGQPSPLSATSSTPTQPAMPASVRPASSAAPRPAMPVTARQAEPIAVNPTAAVTNQQTVRNAAPSTPSSRSDHSVFGDLLPPNFATYPRFVPFQVNEYSRRYTNHCRPFLRAGSTSNNSTQKEKDPPSILKTITDKRSAEEMLQPFASGVGRLVGGLVGTDLLDREGSALVHAIRELKTRQEAAEARAARAEERVATLERQMHVLQQLMQSSNKDALHAQVNINGAGPDKVHEQLRILYRHQRSLEAKINEMGKSPSTKAGDVQSAPAQTNDAGSTVQQMQDADQQTEVESAQVVETGDVRSRSHSSTQSPADGSTRKDGSPKAGNEGLLDLMAAEQERASDEMSTTAPEKQTIPAQDSGVELAAVKGEDEHEPDQLLSGREDTPLTSQSPPVNSPSDKNRWFRRFGLGGRSEGQNADSAQPSAASSKPLKRKRSLLPASFITIDSSDDEAT